ncbi:phage tail protein [Hahella sp. CCB-MM4]|uniref:phage tail protein n=1 Tax=Hahella sp. (strain CCB-MM4) TaxID=1926491 RepID=UPI000B9AA7D6|nr:phage tail protein [Hahella sp. CCB-MM4]OZG70295.1 phage tail protein [Hahella sp. CCB-MM4]
MDTNNTRYFLFRQAEEFEQGSSRLLWHGKHQALMLAQNQTLRLPEVDFGSALTAWENATPLLADQFGQIARFTVDRTAIEFNSGRGYLPLLDGELNPVVAPAGEFTDAFLSGRGRLVAGYSNGSDQHGVLVFDLARRWQSDCTVDQPAVRVWLDPEQRAWSVGESSLALCMGEPLPLPYAPKGERFEPDIINPNSLQQQWSIPLPAGWSALAVSGDQHYLYLLVHDSAGAQRIGKRPLNEIANRPFEWFELAGNVPFSIDLMKIDENRLALLAPKEPTDTDFIRRDCPVVQLKAAEGSELGQAVRINERYPMLSQAVPRFCSCADGQVRYQADPDPDYPGFDERPRELHALRQPHYHLEASALLQQVLDSGTPETLWHRLYLDAYIPSGCSIQISARVFETPEQRGGAEIIDQPSPVWNGLPSELAYQQPFSGYAPNERGVFEILLQREGGAVRQLRGRYLQLQVHFHGNGKQSPALYAIRAYYPRFSYQEAYLPELYRQELSVDPTDSENRANGADIRERLLASFEGMLTPIEGRIAASEQLLHPIAGPIDQLHWLSESLGAPLPVHWPEARQRRWVRQATLIQAFKGTLQGLRLALDIASDGGVERGEVVVVENFRLRRTLATILGRNMDDRDHPLTLGTGMSGNSIVGDSLILSDINAKEFFALFAPELGDEDERAAAARFFKEYAHRISVILNGAGRDKRTVIAECLLQQMPAHLQWQLIETDRPFVLGTSPLLRVDTFIEVEPGPSPVELNSTQIGLEDVLINPAAFSPRDINAQPSTA